MLVTRHQILLNQETASLLACLEQQLQVERVADRLDYRYGSWEDENYYFSLSFVSGSLVVCYRTSVRDRCKGTKESTTARTLAWRSVRALWMMIRIQQFSWCTLKLCMSLLSRMMSMHCRYVCSAAYNRDHFSASAQQDCRAPFSLYSITIDLHHNHPHSCMTFILHLNVGPGMS
jgi:hypothetical protein